MCHQSTENAHRLAQRVKNAIQCYLTLYNYFFFSHLKQGIREKRFETHEELKNVIFHYYNSQVAKFYTEALKKLVQRYLIMQRSEVGLLVTVNVLIKPVFYEYIYLITKQP